MKNLAPVWRIRTTEIPQVPLPEFMTFTQPKKVKIMKPSIRIWSRYPEPDLTKRV
jgi:hypothetical protein